METFWTDIAEIALSPGGLLVLGFLAFALVTAIIAKLRGKQAKDRGLLQEVVLAIANFWK